MPGLSVLPV